MGDDSLYKENCGNNKSSMSEGHKRDYQEFIFIFGTQFSSKKLVESAIGVGADIIGMVKINTKEFFKENIRSLQNIGQEFLTLC